MDENVVQVQEQKEKSYFDGTLLQRIGWVIAGGIVTLITLGICFPVAVFWIYNWETKHTVINGRRLKFTGTAGGFFGKWLLCFVLTIVTAGIYSFFVPIKIKRWREENTFFEDELTEYDSAAKLKFKKASKFDGNIWQFIGLSLLGFAITVCSFGICYPWAVQLIYKWNVKHTVYCEKRCTFDGTALQLFGTWIKWLLLTIITLGIYGWWLPVKIKKWIVKHTVLEGTEAEEKTPVFSKEYILKNKKPLIGAVAIFVFTLSFVNIVLPKVSYNIFADSGNIIKIINFLDAAYGLSKPSGYLVQKIIVAPLAKGYEKEGYKRIEKERNKKFDEEYKKYKNISEASEKTKSKNLNQQLKMIRIPDKNYEIAETEVTQELFFNVTGLNPSRFKEEKNPVEGVSWYEAIAFCNALSKKCGLKPYYKIAKEKGYWPYRWNFSFDPYFVSDTAIKAEAKRAKEFYNYNKADYKRWVKGIKNGIRGSIFKIKCDFSANGYRLPTITEWYYAAEGGETFIYSGSNDIDEVAWHLNNSETKTHAVAQKKPNGYGLYDMLGNVCELIWDDQFVHIDDKGPCRGGNCYSSYKINKFTHEATYDFSNDGPIGFRLVRTTK